jgi:uncharacterized membrane protein YeaQ/YmgE (transglycosylase-associated protein family)
LPERHFAAFDAASQYQNIASDGRFLTERGFFLNMHGRSRERWEDIMVGIDSIIVMVVVGAIAGWLAGKIVRGFGFGLLWNIIIGIIGAFIGVWLLTRLGVIPFSGFVGSIVNAVIGAVILLVIIGLIRR